MELEITKQEKVGEDKKKILYPGSRLFILEGIKVQSPDILKVQPKLVSYRALRINEIKEVTREGGKEAVMVNNTLEIDANTVVVTPESKLENKEGQKKLFVTNNEKVARELSVNTNIIERERLKSVRTAVDNMIKFLDDAIQADSLSS